METADDQPNFTRFLGRMQVDPMTTTLAELVGMIRETGAGSTTMAFRGPDDKIIACVIVALDGEAERLATCWEVDEDGG